MNEVNFLRSMSNTLFHIHSCHNSYFSSAVSVSCILCNFTTSAVMIKRRKPN